MEGATDKHRYLHPEKPVGNVPVSVDSDVMSSHKTNFVNPWLNQELIGNDDQLPQYFKTVTTAFPICRQDAAITQIPYGLIVTPGLVDAPAKVDARTTPIVKCARCGAFMCPWSKVAADGRNWSCGICGYSSLWVSGGSLAEREERKAQVVDYICPTFTRDLMAKARPSFAFIFDISYPSLAAGFTQACAESVILALDQLSDETLVSLLTVGGCVTVHDLKKHRSIAAADFDDILMVTPGPSRLGDIRDHLLACIKEIGNMNPTKKAPGNCYGSALEVLHSILTGIGGVVLAFIYNRAIVGPRAVAGRSKDELLREVSLLKMTPDMGSVFYKDISYMLSKQSISVHLFAASDEFMDLAVMGVPSGLTGGKCYYYGNFSPRFRQMLHNDIFRTISTQYYWDASLKIQTSAGVTLNRVYSNCIMRDKDKVHIGALAPTDSISFELAFEPHVTTQTVMFQLVLTWKNSESQQMTRVFTFSLGIHEDPTRVLMSIDESALTAILVKRMLMKLLTNGATGAMSSFSTGVQKIASIGTLKSAPQLAYGMLKGEFLAEKYPTGADGRLAKLIAIRSYGITDICLYAYPRLTSVTTGELKNLEPKSLEGEPLMILHAVDIIYIWSADESCLASAVGDGLSSDGSVDVAALKGETGDKIRSIIKAAWELSMRYLPVLAIAGKDALSAFYVDGRINETFRFSSWIQKKFTVNV